MAPDRLHYRLGKKPVTGRGLGFSDKTLGLALKGPIADLVYDVSGNANIQVLLAGLADTEFPSENLAALLANGPASEDWRVGEALAEHFLTENHNCMFPWPDGRDERRPNSSLPGADLVGFMVTAAGERFAFGEVKTSADASYPPNVVYGKHGLQRQIEDLRDNLEIRRRLILYLGYRAGNASWRTMYQRASIAYLVNNCDVQLLGVLVRDVTPRQEDLRTRVANSASACPTGMIIQFFALYLPPGSISSLASRVEATRSKGGGG